MTGKRGPEVYQCKNYRRFHLSNLRQAIEKFRNEWLSSSLPVPKRFVLCCPVVLRDLSVNRDWLKEGQKLRDETGIDLAFWHREYLDERLKQLPDLVSDLFGDSWAQSFCTCRDWSSDYFRPVHTNSGDRMIDRFLQARESISLAPEAESRFKKLSSRSTGLLICGPPGSGKTTAALALTQSDSSPTRRAYYADLRYEWSENYLIEGMRQRLSQPTTFILDNCTGSAEQLANIYERVEIFSRRSRLHIRLILISRTVKTPTGKLRSISGLEMRFQDDDAILLLQPTPEDYYRIIVHRKPSFSGLARKRVKHLFNLTGGNLALLDLALAGIQHPSDVDNFAIETLFTSTLRHYFGKNLVNLPRFHQLSALAQFEIAPPVSWIGDALTRENPTAESQLTTWADRPPRCFFVHASTAELIFLALAANDRQQPIKLAASRLVAYFEDPMLSQRQIRSDLVLVMANRLGLMSYQDEIQLKCDVLQAESIQLRIGELFDQLPLDFLARCLVLLHKGQRKRLYYKRLVQKNTQDGTLLKLLLSRPFDESVSLYYLFRHYPSLPSMLRRQVTDGPLAAILEQTTFAHFIQLMASLGPFEHDVWIEQIPMLSARILDDSIARGLKVHRGLGTLHRCFADLASSDPNFSKRLEKQIGGQRFLSLIRQAGTFLELVRFLNALSEPMAEDICGRIEEQDLDHLIQKHLRGQNPTRVLNLQFRRLRRHRSAAFDHLERLLGSRRLLDLLCSRGSLVDLVKTLPVLSPDISGEMLRNIDASTADRLVAETIEHQHSISTMHMSMRQLVARQLGEFLERVVGSVQWAHLISEAGTIVELCQILCQLSEALGQQILRLLGASGVSNLLQKAIAGQRNINTLGRLLVSLKARHPQTYLELVELIDRQRFAELISNLVNPGVGLNILESLDEAVSIDVLVQLSHQPREQQNRFFHRGSLQDYIPWIAWQIQRRDLLLDTNSLSALIEPFADLAESADPVEIIAGIEKLITLCPWQSGGSETFELLTRLLARRRVLRTFRSGVISLQLLFNTHNAIRHTLAERMLDMMPPSKDWLDDGKFIDTMRFPMFLLAVYGQSDVDRREILRIAVQPPVAIRLYKCPSYLVFRYLWNLLLLWLSIHPGAPVAEFARFLSPQLRTTLQQKLVDTFPRNAKPEEVDSWIMLLGLMSFVQLPTVSFRRQPVGAARPEFCKLSRKAPSKGLVGGIFYLLGLEWLQAEKAVGPAVWDAVLRRASDYSPSVGIEHLIRLATLRSTGQLLS